jgi:hypothetical protein
MRRGRRLARRKSTAKAHVRGRWYRRSEFMAVKRTLSWPTSWGKRDTRKKPVLDAWCTHLCHGHVGFEAFVRVESLSNEFLIVPSHT